MGNEASHPHACGHCSKRFAQPIDLIRHTAAVHNPKAGHPCPYCKKSFKAAESLQQHLKASHSLAITLTPRPRRRRGPAGQSQRNWYARMMADMYDDLPDGAFWAVLQEHGVYPEDFG